MKIAFVGIMGCGKTSMAKEISQVLNLKYISIDEEIEKESKLPITEIFDTFGEKYFRDLESESLSRLINCNRCIVDCGGGIVLNSENIIELKNKKFKIVFIDRKPDQIIKDIDINDRPLLKNNPEKLYDIYNERIELYKSAADLVIENNKSFKEVLLEIIDAIK